MGGFGDKKPKEMIRSNIQRQESAVYNRNKAIELLKELKIRERRSTETVIYYDKKTIRKKHTYKGTKQFKNGSDTTNSRT